MEFTDILTTIFAVKGLSGLLNAFKASGDAQSRLAMAEQAYIDDANKGNATAKVRIALLNAQAEAAEAAGAAEGALGTLIVGAAVMEFHMIEGAVKSATEQYFAYAKEVANIRDLTGSTAEESSKFAAVLKVAGISDMQGARELLRLTKDLGTAQGALSLQRLGVVLKPGETGLTMIRDVVTQIHAKHKGLAATQLEENLLGARNVLIIQQLARLTDKQVDAAERSALILKDADLSKAQEAQEQFNQAGLIFQSKVIFPLAQVLLPMLEEGAEGFGKIVTLLDRIGQNSGVFLIINGTIDLINANLKVLLFTLDHITGAFSDFINFAAKTLHIDIGGFGDAAKDAAQSQQSANMPLQDALGANVAQTKELTDAVNRLNQGGIPGALNPQDLSTLSGLHELMAVS